MGVIQAPYWTRECQGSCGMRQTVCTEQDGRVVPSLAPEDTECELCEGPIPAWTPTTREP